MVPPAIALGARITGSDWTEGGLDGDDAVAFARELKAVGLRFRVRVVGRRDRRDQEPDGTGLQRAARRAGRREAGIADPHGRPDHAPKQAEALVAEGKADMVALARGLLDDPRWGWHSRRSGSQHMAPMSVARRNIVRDAPPRS